MISEELFTRFSQFLKSRATSVQNNIKTRHEKKLKNLSNESTSAGPIIDSSKWVINLSSKPLTSDERAILNKGPKFAPTPPKIPTKVLVAEIEAAITKLPEESKDAIRTSTADLIRRSDLPKHKNTTANERKAFYELKKDKTRVVMKADKGNCFVVMDKADYDAKMQELLSDHNTYDKVAKAPYKKIERELNSQLLQLKQHHKLDERTYKKLHSTNGIPPAIRGSVKHHKPNNPLRPIVTCRNTTLYNTSKYLADILAPLQNNNGFSVTNSTDFAHKLSNTFIEDDEIMVSFDVVSLFTAIPVEKTCEHIRNKLLKDSTLQQRTNLTIDDIIKLLRFTLSNSYFNYNKQTYKQIHGCAMGSPVSPIVANLCLEVIEELALAQATTPPKKWFRYVDDVFSIIKKHALDSFHNLLNSIDPDINFTIEHEQDGRLSFLDISVSRNNGRLITNVYRKPTHTDNYFDFNSHHDKQHKISTAQTLLHQAASLPNTSEGRQQEREHVLKALAANGYPQKFLADVEKKRALREQKTPSPEKLVREFFERVDPSTKVDHAVLPYIKGLTEPLKRLLKPYGIRVATKPLLTLEQMLPSPKDRPPSEEQTNVIYRINCADCSWSYIGETGRAFITRKKEHMKNVEKHKAGSNIANHAWSFDHKIDFQNCKIIDKANYRHRATLESWHTVLTTNADNNSKHLPEQYRFLLKK